MKAYTINLERRPDRLEQIKWECSRANLDLKVIKACDGSDKQIYPVVGAFRNSREHACWKSHKNAWLAALSDLKGQQDFVLFIEDDVVFVDNFRDKLDQALKEIPAYVKFLYIGHLHYSDKRVPVSEQNVNSEKWIIKSPVFGLHCYMIRAQFLLSYYNLLTTMEHNNHFVAIDDCITLNTDNYWVLKEPLAYQMPCSSDITSWRSVVNPSYIQIINQIKLSQLWSPQFYPEVPEIPKQLILLPGQKWVFSLPPDWKIIKIEYYSDIPEYDRFAQVIPFSYWSALTHGGLVFTQYLSGWTEKFTGNTEHMFPDHLFVKKGSNQLKDKIQNFCLKHKMPRDEAWF